VRVQRQLIANVLAKTEAAPPAKAEGGEPPATNGGEPKEASGAGSRLKKILGGKSE
jgi:hypothetical protein